MTIDENLDRRQELVKYMRENSILLHPIKWIKADLECTKLEREFQTWLRERRSV